MVQYEMKSSIGSVYLSASDKGLQRADFRKSPGVLQKTLDGNHAADKILLKTIRQLEEYFDGRRTTFDLPLDIGGTPFQKKVWKELSRIPFGRTVSYREVARKISHPQAMRAVGNANGKNPICIIIPCHRVIAADGSIGGYSGGLANKRRLLQLEGDFKF